MRSRFNIINSKMKGSAQNNKQKQPLQTKDQAFKPQGPAPLRKLQGVKTYTQGVSPPDNFFQLDKVIGLSSRGSTSIALNPVTGEIAYPAGAIICIYSPKENKQTKFLYSLQQQRSYSCLAFSGDGKYLAAGEGAFRQPEITIWEIEGGEYKEIKHLRGHKYGIESVMFSPNILYLISLGDANDRGLFVWDWRTEQRVTSNKLGKPVNTFAFSSLNSFFVTAGYQHLKYWYFDEQGRVQKTVAQAGSNTTESIMESKSADLTKVKVKIFVGVQCVANGGQSGKEEQVFALASDGHLFVYDKNRKLSKWMNIKVDRALSCILGGEHLYCACNDGIVRIFSSKSLEHIMTLSKPPPLGSANVEGGNKKIRLPAHKDSRFADSLAVLVDEKNQRIVVLYSDRMIFIWDVSKMDKISVYRTLYSHSGPIYDLQYIPNNLTIGFQSQGLSDQMLTDDEMTNITKFATCSADRTIRFWNFVDPQSQISQEKINKLLIKNAYSKDMSRMIYVSNVDPRDPTNPNSSPQNQYEYFKVRPINLNEDGTPKQDVSLTTQQQRELEQLRCIKISPDGKHLACGDWTGNIRIHDLQQNTASSLYSTYDEIQCIQAHDSEVVCLDYSPLTSTPSNNVYFGGASDDQAKFWLASGSRDRLTHIYEYNSQSSSYQNVAILDDHSGTITSINFAEEKSLNGMKKRMKLISSGADKQIVVRSIQPAGTNFMSSIPNNADNQNDSVFQSWLLKKEQCKHKVLSMDIAGGYGISGHDKYIQLWQVTTPSTSGFDKLLDRKVDSQKKSSVLDHIRVMFGPSNQTGLGNPLQPGCEIIIASCADKSVTIYETATGNAIAKTTCGEVTTAMCLSTNLKHLITASMDGIIYFWRLPENLSKALIKLRSEQPLIQQKAKPQDFPLKFQQSPNQNDNIQLLAQDETQKVGEFDLGQDQDVLRKNSNNDEFQQDRDYMDESSIADQSQYNQQPPPSISMIMQQINQVTSKIQNIQPMKNRNQQQFSQTQGEDLPPREEIHENGQQPSFQHQSQRSRRNAWGAKTSPNRDPHTSGGEDLDNNQSPQVPAEDNEEGGVRQPHFKDNKLPRWAQSMAGINPNNNTAHEAADPFSHNENQLSGIIENTNDLDDVFNNILEKVEETKGSNTAVAFNRVESQTNDNQNYEEEEITPIKFHPPPKPIDFLATLDGEKPHATEEDPDEAMIREQLRLRNMQHKQMLGLDSSDDDSDGGADTKANRIKDTQMFENNANRVLRRPSENRQSQSQLFLQRKKEQQNQEGANQNGSKQETLKVEDIFNESHDQQLPVIQQKVSAPEQRYEPVQQLQNTMISDINPIDQQDRVNNFTDFEEESKQHESLTSEAMVKIIGNQSKQEESIKEQNVNLLLKEEISKINQSLFRINQCLNAVKVGESSQLNVKIKDEVEQSIVQSLDLWNTLAHTLGNKQAPLPEPSESNANLTLPKQEKPSKITSDGQYSVAPSISNYSMPLSSAISIKEDAKDLLERYSDLLLAEVLKKINKQI